MKEDRRGSPRSSIDCEIRIVTPSSSHVARLRTLSRLGALIRLEHALPVGTPVSLRVFVPGSEGQLELRGQIVRAEASEGAADVAIMFAPLPAFAVSKLDSVIASSDS